MASIQINNDKLEGRGDAMEFLREIVHEIGRGYTSGPGWAYSEDGIVAVMDTETIDRGGETLTDEETRELAEQIVPPGTEPPAPTETAPEDTGEEPWNKPPQEHDQGHRTESEAAPHSGPGEGGVESAERDSGTGAVRGSDQVGTGDTAGLPDRPGTAGGA